MPPRKVHTLAEQLEADREYELGLPHEKLTDELTVEEAEANFVHIRDNWARYAPDTRVWLKETWYTRGFNSDHAEPRQIIVAPTSALNGLNLNEGNSNQHKPAASVPTGPTCFNCGERGHKQYDCTAPKKGGVQKPTSRRVAGSLRDKAAAKAAAVFWATLRKEERER